jgi:hypothetical protein
MFFNLIGAANPLCPVKIENYFIAALDFSTPNFKNGAIHLF